VYIGGTRMNRQSVKSSNVKSIGYDELKQVLEVEFNNGTIYQYLKVPENIYINVITAPSIGSAIHSVLNGRFSYRKV
jgi:hypothetical protein